MTADSDPASQAAGPGTSVPQLLHHLEAVAGGPHDPDATVAVAWMAAETIRYLNYATRIDEGVQYAAALYTVAGALSLAASRIPQLASQVRAWLNANSGRLRNDDGAPVSDTLAIAGASGPSTRPRCSRATWASCKARSPLPAPATALPREKTVASSLFPPVPPHSDFYTWHLTETALRDLASHRGRWPGDPLTTVTMLASLIEQAERMIPELTAEARRQRASWAVIATALGTSPEQTELRYSPWSPIRDTREPYCPVSGFVLVLS
jgi:hypothetical protein